MRKKAGDATLSELYGYKRLDDNDGQPIMTTDGYYIYKQINLLGDGQYASEYKLFPTKSPINNGTVKIEQEIPDNDILRYMFKDVSPIIPATIQTYIPNEPVTNRVIVPEQAPVVVSDESKEEKVEVVDNQPVAKEGKSIFESRNNPLEYTSKQTKALADIQKLIDANKQGYYLLAGYAGTGKTTIAENIAVYAQSHGRPVFVLAPTNKATKVLGDKFKNAGVTPEISTIHRAIYGEPDPETGDWIPKANLKNAVIVVDESSMIEKSVMADLIENTKKNNVIVFMGDSFQLEPVGDDSGLFKGEIEQVKDNKSELTEVRRQSFDSNVLKLATLMRIDNKAYVPTVSVEDVKVSKSRDEFISDFRQSVKNNEDSVMIVATNPERMAMNTVARIEKFGSSRKVLNDGEVLAAVANSVDVSNSEIFKIASVRDEGTKHELTFKFGNKTQTFDMYLSYVVLENGKEVKVMHFPQLDRPSLHHGQILQAMRESNRELFENLDNGSDIIYTKKGSKLSPAIVISTYGYAVTAHKSQGSQWSKVFVNQNYSAPTWNPARWFYTAVTRSSKDVIILPTSVNQRINPMDMNARIDQIAKESVPLDLVTLKDGSTYNRADITANMLEEMKYTPEEIGEILKSIC
jgi:energy-coupling factor transporter ATP-binding protein EcfA2